MTDVEAMIEELDSAGDLPAGFGPLFRSVPREWFIPDRVWAEHGPVDRESEPDTWLANVYADTSLVTQFDDGEAVWPEAGGRPTSSASMPSVVAGMLDALDVHEGHDVLEIGTGTGFNAALLAELVGDSGSVTTMEIDRVVLTDSEQRLKAAKYGQVRCVLGDGTSPPADAGPFDRIICTAAVHLGRIPYEWVSQTRPSGVIVTPVRADLASGPLVRFVVNGDGTATGQTLPMGVGFMEVRSQRTAETPDEPIEWEQDGTGQSTTGTKPWPVLGDPSSRWALAVALPSCRYNVLPSNEDRPYKLAWLRDPVSYSWASVAPDGTGRYLVRQHGIRRLWDEAEAAQRWWRQSGQPATTDWEWSITPDSQTVRVAPRSFLAVRTWECDVNGSTP